jgi:hypothetical protein
LGSFGPGRYTLTVLLDGSTSRTSLLHPWLNG